MTEEEFFEFCQENNFFSMERTSDGAIILKEPAGDYTSNFNVKLTTELEIWNRKFQIGYAFDSSAGFTLPNKAVRSADGSWILKERFEALTERDKERFGHICPDFVIEVKSPSDTMSELKKKMREWIENGCRLAWLINPGDSKTIIYKNDGSIQEKAFDEIISGEDVLPGFELQISRLTGIKY